MSTNNYLILESDKACQLQCWQLLIWLTQNKCPISGVSSLSTLKKSKNTNSVILHKVKSNQVSHGAWSVVNI